MDGDPDQETVRAVPVASTQDPGTTDFTVEIADPCPAASPITARVAGPQAELGYLRLIDADVPAGQEAVIDLRSGRLGEAKVIAWRITPGNPCGSPREIFSYNAFRSTKAPQKTRGLASWGISVRELEGRFGGKEVLLDEGFARTGERLCCPTLHKLTYYRFNAALDHYVRYSTKLQRRPGGKGKSN